MVRVRLEGGKEFDASLYAHGAENIFAVAIALVDGGSRSAGRAGHAAHGEGFFAAPGPQPAGGVKNALFELQDLVVWAMARLRSRSVTTSA